jgi:hypothetical protein
MALTFKRCFHPLLYVCSTLSVLHEIQNINFTMSPR